MPGTLRRWRPALLVVTLVVVLGALVAVLAVGVLVPRPSPYVGVWVHAGGAGERLTVAVQNGRLRLRFADGGVGWADTVPKAGDMAAIVVVPIADLPSGLGPLPQGATTPALLDIANDGNHLTLRTQGGTGLGSLTYARLRGGFPWFAALFIGGAFLALVLAFYLARSRWGMTRREKISLVLLIAAGILVAAGIIAARPALLWLAAGPLSACWMLVIMRAIAGDIPDFGVGVGLVTSRARRDEYRELLDAQDAQSRRGEALSDALDRFSRERERPGDGETRD